MNDGSKWEEHWHEVPAHVIVNHYMKGLRAGKHNRRIVDFGQKWFYDPNKAVFIIRVYTEEKPPK